MAKIKQTKADLLAEYKRLAKQADQRLVRLEKAATDREYFKPATQWAYARAQYDIEARFGEGANRFNKVLPKKYTKQQIQAAISDVQQFISSPTSTVQGIKKTYQNRVDTLNKKYGTNFKWNEFAEFIESEQWKKLSNMYGSDQILKQVAKRAYDKKTVKKTVKDETNRTVRTDKSEVIKNIMEELDRNGLTVADLM